jgi:hypothetical protein
MLPFDVSAHFGSCTAAFTDTWSTSGLFILCGGSREDIFLLGYTLPNTQNSTLVGTALLNGSFPYSDGSCQAYAALISPKMSRQCINSVGVSFLTTYPPKIEGQITLTPSLSTGSSPPGLHNEPSQMTPDSTLKALPEPHFGSERG